MADSVDYTAPPGVASDVQRVTGVVFLYTRLKATELCKSDIARVSIFTIFRDTLCVFTLTDTHSS